MSRQTVAVIALGVVGAGCAIGIALARDSVGVIVTLSIALFMCVLGLLSEVS